MRSGSVRPRQRRRAFLLTAAIAVPHLAACGASPHLHVTGRWARQEHRRDAAVFGALELRDASSSQSSAGPSLSPAHGPVTHHSPTTDHASSHESGGFDSDDAQAVADGSQPAAALRQDSPREELGRALQAYHRATPPLSALLEQVRIHYASNQSGIDSMITRARLRGLVPDVRVSVRRGQGVDLRREGIDETNLRLTTDDSLALEATLSFDLGELVYADDEPRLHALRARARSTRRAVLAQVEATYFAHMTLYLKMRATSPTPEQVARFAELTAHIDGLTGGWFSSWPSDEGSGAIP